MKEQIVWKTCFKSPPEKVYQFLNSQQGRESFWAENANERDGRIYFQFINGQKYESQILDREEPYLYSIDYFQSKVYFELTGNEFGGTDLTMRNTQIPEEEYMEMYAGWVSLLMCFKAAVDHGVDLRNHDSNRSWDQGFVEN